MGALDKCSMVGSQGYSYIPDAPDAPYIAGRGTVSGVPPELPKLERIMATDEPIPAAFATVPTCFVMNPPSPLKMGDLLILMWEGLGLAGAPGGETGAALASTARTAASTIDRSARKRILKNGC